VGLLLAVRSVIFAVLGLFLLDAARRATLRGHWRTVAISCFTSVAGPLLYFGAVSRMSATTVTLIFFVYPAIVVIGARLVGRIHITPAAIGVTAITLTGAALAIGAPSGRIDPLGVVLSLAFALVVAVYFLAAEHGLEGADPLAWLGVSVVFAAIVFVPLAPFLGGLAVPDATGGLALLMVAVGCALIPCLFQTMGLMRLGSAATSLVATLEIATVVVGSFLLLGETPRPLGAVGAVLVMIGAATAPIAMRRRVPPTSPL
jgi:drug/metabolite transporter (DMT)-like permease